MKKNKKNSQIVVTYYTKCCLNHSVYHLRGYSGCFLFTGAAPSALMSNISCWRGVVEWFQLLLLYAIICWDVALINKFNAEPATTVTVKSSGKQFYLQIPSYTTYICYMYCFTDRHRLWTGGLGNSFRCSCILLPVNVEHWPKTSSKMFAGFLLARLCVWG